MICLVTGAAGFIGSHLCRALLQQGISVVGIDSFADYYPRWIKEDNLRPVLTHSDFRFIEGDLNFLDLEKKAGPVDAVFHLAAQAGVRSSWGSDFSIYTKANLDVTQRILEWAKSLSLQRFVYASSSSVYGSCPDLPWSETSLPAPFSPYGVTKLGGEQLTLLYHRNYRVPAVALRFFTVFGPGQRPDMAFHRFMKAAWENQPIPVFGDGKQTRDFTYIDDIVKANISALNNGRDGEVYNIGGGHRIALSEVLPIIENIVKRKLTIRHEDEQKGDAPHTFADISKAADDLGYQPGTSLEEGLQNEWEWLNHIYSRH